MILTRLWRASSYPPLAGKLIIALGLCVASLGIGCAGGTKRTAAELRLQEDGLRVQVAGLQRRAMELQVEHRQAMDKAQAELARQRKTDTRLSQQLRTARTGLEEERRKLSLVQDKAKAIPLLSRQIADLKRQIAILQTRHQLECKKLRDQIRRLEKKLGPKAQAP